VGIVQKSNRKIVGRDKGDTLHTQNTLLTWTVVYKYMAAQLNHSIQMFGSLEHVVDMKTVSIGQGTSINNLPTYYTRIMIMGS